MSLVYINYHNETVYDWGHEEGDIIYRPGKYTSKHKDRIQKEKVYDVVEIEPNKKLITAKKPGLSLHKTMGYAQLPLKKSGDFLRKNEGIKCVKERGHFCDEVVHRAPVPKREDFKKRPQSEPKNYEKLNIDYVKSAKTRRPIPKFADTRNGDTHELCKAGVMPAYIYAPKFGKIPRYLLKTTTEKAVCEEKETTQIKSDIELLSSNERNELLSGLKTRWLEIQKNFQTLPVFTDTQLRKQRKTRMEKELRQLEEDILLIENNPYIYICN